MAEQGNKKFYSITVHVDEELYAIWSGLDETRKKELKENFRRLLRSAYVPTRPAFVCPICLAPFSSYDPFAQHFMHEHSELKCGVCGYKPVDKRNPHNDLYFHYLEQHGRLDAH